MLIQKGAVPVDFNGKVIEGYIKVDSQETISLSNEPEINYENRILKLLKTGKFSTKDILKRLQIDWTEYYLRNFLRSQNSVEEIKKSPLQFTMKVSIRRRTYCRFHFDLLPLFKKHKDESENNNYRSFLDDGVLTVEWAECAGIL